MDTLRGPFGSFDDDTRDEDYGDEDIGREAPPSPVGQDERRMQVRAYNHWASLLQDRTFPAIDDLDVENLPDFGPHSVLLDFSSGIDNPAIRFLGGTIAQECGTDGAIASLDDVPSRSLLSRITDHYMQILANQAPIGFEAEFVNQRGVTILYRGILLPFSSDDETIDFIYGVINWKEVADQLTTDELLLEIGQALETGQDDDSDETELPAVSQDEIPAASWADGPSVGDTAPHEERDSEAEVEAAEEPADHFDTGDADNDDPLVSEFALPDLGDLDEEDTIDHSAYASLAPASEADDEDTEPSSLSGLRNKPAKKPLDLSGAHMLASQDEEEPAFGEDLSRDEAAPTEDDPLDALLSSDELDDSDDEDDWSTPVGEQLSDTLDMPTPAFDAEDGEQVEETLDAGEAAGASTEEESSGDAPADIEIPTVEESAEEQATDAAPAAEAAEGLYDTLAEARELAQVARTREDRSRAALYDAVSRAYDVSLAAAEAPEDFAELVAENGLAVQDRAPMTPIVKLVFGADYDKTRVTEYAAVLDHAHRKSIGRGNLAGFLAEAEGGLKGVVQAERRLRREEAGKPATDDGTLSAALLKKLRALETTSFDALDSEGPEFGVVMIRRLENGEIVLVGEVGDDVKLADKVGRKLVG